MTKTQLLKMFELQGLMNEKVNPDWLTSHYPFLLAAMVESVEGIDHHGWKWWKAQEPDMSQLCMELVDVWHFAISYLTLNSGGNAEEAVDLILKDQGYSPHGLTFDGVYHNYVEANLVENLRLMAGLCAANRFDVSLFMHILKQADMDFNDLYEQYIGKNVLNFFRQDNGYKEGTYTKEWDGQEDNVYLVEILRGLDSTHEDYMSNVYTALEETYKELVG